ncbi:unnamed protein product, partial [Urochloa humidicola]
SRSARGVTTSIQTIPWVSPANPDLLYNASLTDKTSAAKVSPTVSNMVRMSLLMVAVLLQLPVIALLRYGIQKQQIACILSSHCVL